MYSAEKSGLAKEEEERMKSKFDQNQAKEALGWISSMINENFDTTGTSENFVNQLRNGVRLCKLINVLMPGKIKKINTGNIAFQLMENINAFNNACVDYGMNNAETFKSYDLWEAKNPHQVCICIHALGRKAQKNGLKGLGPKEAEKNERAGFDEAKILENKTAISLQYGTNKVASQSGQNFGNSRHM